MSNVNLFSETVLLPLGDFFTGRSISKCLKFLRESQYWSREQIDDFQNQKLRELIHHSYKHVPFYHELFKDLRITPSDIQTKADLPKLPVITKDDLKKNKAKHIASNIEKSAIISASSSGSTGEPFQYFKTRQSESFLKAAAIRGWEWMDYRLGDAYVKVSMNPRASSIKKIQDFLNNSLYLSSTKLEPVEFHKIVKAINKYNPKFIRCYPVPLSLLARQFELEQSLYKGTNLIAINTTGSTLHERERDEIERIFGVKVFDSYSCEGGAIFFECPDHNRYHPCEEYAIQEYLEDSFTFSNPERPLRHITTDLHNYASPFIRYDTGDYIVIDKEESCSCGRHFKNITKIFGRDSDVLKTPSGKYLIVENFVAYFEWIKEVDQIQVLQKESDLIVIKLVVNKDFNNSILNNIQDYWTSCIGSDVSLNLEIVDHIDLTPAGKRRTVIRSPHININGRY